MSLFNFRRAGSSSAPNAASGAQTESVEVIRKRAKHRLIGSAVLVLIGVVGFPLLFDTQPRPIAIDIPIEIPGKNSVKPLVLPGASTQSAAPAAKASSSSAGANALAAAPAAPEKIAAAASLGAREEILTEKTPLSPARPASSAIKKEIKNEAKPAPKVEAKSESKAEPKIEVKVASSPVPALDAGNRARALLDGKPNLAAAATVAKSENTAVVEASAATAAEGRMIVQVGAFADVEKAREARLKLEKAGLKTYTQVVETAGGKRIRVRVGPFATKVEADKAASKIKALDLPAAVLTL